MVEKMKGKKTQKVLKRVKNIGRTVSALKRKFIAERKIYEQSVARAEGYYYARDIYLNSINPNKIEQAINAAIQARTWFELNYRIEGQKKSKDAQVEELMQNLRKEKKFEEIERLEEWLIRRMGLLEESGAVKWSKMRRYNTRLTYLLEVDILKVEALIRALKEKLATLKKE